MYGENNQYQQFNNMPYDNTGVQPAAPQDNQQAGNGPEKPESRKKKDSVWRFSILPLEKIGTMIVFFSDSS